MGENSIYRVEIRRLEVTQPNYHWDMFLFGEVQEFPGHGNQSWFPCRTIGVALIGPDPEFGSLRFPSHFRDTHG
jgi:hypothetical protein